MKMSYVFTEAGKIYFLSLESNGYVEVCAGKYSEKNEDIYFYANLNSNKYVMGSCKDYEECLISERVVALLNASCKELNINHIFYDIEEIENISLSEEK